MLYITTTRIYACVYVQSTVLVRYMTAHRLSEISNEVAEIDRRLSFLSPSNSFENRTRKILISRLVELRDEINQSILENRKQRLQLV